MSDEIVLRPLRLEDIDDEYCGWYSATDGHLDYFTGSGRAFDRQTLVDDFRRGTESGRWFYYIVEHLTDGTRIGNVKIGPIDQRNRTSDLVCMIGNRSYVGRGLAPVIITKANTIAFDEFGMRRLHGGMYATNVPSIKAYTRAGWVIEGTFRGYYLVDGKAVDRVCVCCLNPRFFPDVAT